ncbi:hypothetical protein AN644_03715 [Candidatus Epulonipiscium fishelsonii]|nr:hypothetical protein AN644_03715 [Epulopiscium sp. SCG-C06WGA-EpuloA1]
MDDILLNAGTGEVEIVEFVVNERKYGINVLKVKGIVSIEGVTPLPKSNEQIAGLTSIRGQMDTVIDLSIVLHGKKTVDFSEMLGLLCEFNETIVVFLVNRVEGIRRIRWEEIKQTNTVNKESVTIGTVMQNDQIIVLLDFESITIQAGIGKGYEKDRHSIFNSKNLKKDEKIILVEDSRAIRELLKCSLEEGGYHNIKIFENGKQAQDYIFAVKEELEENFEREMQLVITDVEMPILDGYTLTRSIKEDPILNSLPVIIFSSLITEQLYHKGKAIGADMQISKPSMKELVDVVNMFFGHD